MEARKSEWIGLPIALILSLINSILWVLVLPFPLSILVGAPTSFVIGFLVGVTVEMVLGERGD